MVKTRPTPKLRRRPEVRPRAPRGKGRRRYFEININARLDTELERQHIRKAANELELSLIQFAIRAMTEKADQVLGHSALNPAPEGAPASSRLASPSSQP